MTTDAMQTLCRHAVSAQLADIPGQARAAARTFIGDSLGVAMAGSQGPLCDALLQAHPQPGNARVLGTGDRVAPGAAALLNAYQVHNSEFDCVHDQAVVHPFAVLLGTVLAVVDTEDRAISGAEFLTAVIAGVDVGLRIGAASRSPMRFFRPATAGAFAATAAAARLSGFDEARTLAAMGITLGQLCGTMQAHTEGSPLLPVQAGFNARNALLARDLAALDVSGARQVLEGDFGYFALFDGDHDISAVTADLGARWFIAEVSHKPFPSGRATHGVVDACLELMREHGFSAGDVAAVEAAVPPLTHRLVGRPPRDDMDTNYARLCARYVAARALLRRQVDLTDFSANALADATTLALARRVDIEVDDNPDPNALTPVQVSVRLTDGRVLQRRMDTVYGSPSRPMTRDAHLAKLRSNCLAARNPPSADAVERLIAALDELETQPDVRALLELVNPA